MKILKTGNLIALLIFAFVITSQGQENQIIPNTLNQIEVDEIVRKFTKHEDDFRFALSNYVFKRSATIHTIGLGGQVTGTYRRDSFMNLTADGKRFEKIEYFPISTLTELQITLEDIEDLGGVNPFALEPRNISMYTFSYVGKQKIDELDLHVFDVRPKVIPNPDKSKIRLFVGRIWVDDQDFMIVKSKGKGIPEGKQRFPVVETWRDSVDGKYWFPVYSSSNDELIFESGQVVKIKVLVRYGDYKQGRSEVIILDDDTPVVEEDQPSEPPKQPKPPPGN